MWLNAATEIIIARSLIPFFMMLGFTLITSNLPVI